MSDSFLPAQMFKPGPPKKHIQYDRGGIEAVYNSTTVNEMLRALEGCVSRRVAARFAGICEQTMQKWMTSHPEFAAAVEEAEARTEASLSTTLTIKARNGDTKALMFLLERRFSEDWKERKEQDINVTAGISSEDLDSKLARIAADLEAASDPGATGF